MTNFLKFYWLEDYLFDEVGPKFRESGMLEPVDLFMIFIWKANRAKNKERARLRKLAPDGKFSTATAQIAQQLTAAREPKDKLRALMDNWKMRLPMASAVLTVLYPSDFTVYDVRIREEVGVAEDYSYKLFSDELWGFYCLVKDLVIAESPPLESLRDCDRWLWGKSLREQAELDCRDDAPDDDDKEENES